MGQKEKLHLFHQRSEVKAKKCDQGYAGLQLIQFMLILYHPRGRLFGRRLVPSADGERADFVTACLMRRFISKMRSDRLLA